MSTQLRKGRIEKWGKADLIPLTFPISKKALKIYGKYRLRDNLEPPTRIINRYYKDIGYFLKQDADFPLPTYLKKYLGYIRNLHSQGITSRQYLEGKILIDPRERGIEEELERRKISRLGESPELKRNRANEEPYISYKWKLNEYQRNKVPRETQISNLTHHINLLTLENKLKVILIELNNGIQEDINICIEVFENCGIRPEGDMPSIIAKSFSGRILSGRIKLTDILSYAKNLPPIWRQAVLQEVSNSVEYEPYFHMEIEKELGRII